MQRQADVVAGVIAEGPTAAKAAVVVDLSDKGLSSLDAARASLNGATTELNLAFNEIASLGGGGERRRPAAL